MTQTLSIKDTRNKLADIVNQVAILGDSFVITKFGKPKAIIVPFTQEKAVSGNFDEVFGAWKERLDIKDSAKWVRNLRTKISLRFK